LGSFGERAKIRREGRQQNSELPPVSLVPKKNQTPEGATGGGVKVTEIAQRIRNSRKNKSAEHKSRRARKSRAGWWVELGHRESTSGFH